MKKVVSLLLISIVVFAGNLFAQTASATASAAVGILEETPPVSAAAFKDKVAKLSAQVCEIFDLSGEIFATCKADADSTAQEKKLEKATSDFSTAIDDLKGFAMEKGENPQVGNFMKSSDGILDSLEKFFELAEAIIMALEDGKDSAKNQEALKSLRTNLLNQVKTLETIAPQIIALP
ncbi:MAG: hypothetical protein HQM10_20690 [Candidatus Riflebacteria bacterium]|nr:hypothetical protein [Candidatus Riflebacteria bacterium]